MDITKNGLGRNRAISEIGHSKDRRSGAGSGSAPKNGEMHFGAARLPAPEVGHTTENWRTSRRSICRAQRSQKAAKLAGRQESKEAGGSEKREAHETRQRREKRTDLRRSYVSRVSRAISGFGGVSCVEEADLADCRMESASVRGR
jgi:hypothetical protein